MTVESFTGKLYFLCVGSGNVNDAKANSTSASREAIKTLTSFTK